ncbi:plastid/chloroplast ribosomal protein S6 [Volvox carteri f. nagariensis]|uniref:Plastid/chloroplast ribosomal protein S6 n=1 Tax=Volvox carteri f. nagariensis TaxID=3068 RepID=D8UHI0_VOLCA|nr:plastid/chloroplast ribosomal protein S6 [Volvox carteri f. nagariensis]EFJ40855.1 plastid/chloroplast ribosomal protein S6 [Volvox carteri f. nagariensis]|eukprot:XP_002958124.1 plastid/chloroplast ribosomal protein S6 [Volvox carteri f. nagariensis]
MATTQRSCTATARAGTTASLVAARPIAHHLCFQRHVARTAGRQQRAVAGRAMPQIVAAAAVDAVVEEPKKLPLGFHRYETMMILKPSLSDEERDRELAKFEAYLNKQECYEINALVRGRSKLAYPIKKEWEGIYVLYSYVASRQTGRAVQLLLSNPEAGAEDTVLRHITLCKQ